MHASMLHRDAQDSQTTAKDGSCPQLLLDRFVHGLCRLCRLSMPRVKRRVAEPCDCLDCVDAPVQSVPSTVVPQESLACVVFLCFLSTSSQDIPAGLRSINSIVQQGSCGLAALKAGLSMHPALSTCLEVSLILLTCRLYAGAANTADLLAQLNASGVSTAGKCSLLGTALLMHQRAGRHRLAQHHRQVRCPVRPAAVPLWGLHADTSTQSQAADAGSQACLRPCCQTMLPQLLPVQDTATSMQQAVLQMSLSSCWICSVRLIAAGGSCAGLVQASDIALPLQAWTAQSLAPRVSRISYLSLSHPQATASA